MMHLLVAQEFDAFARSDKQPSLSMFFFCIFVFCIFVVVLSIHLPVAQECDAFARSEEQPSLSSATLRHTSFD